VVIIDDYFLVETVNLNIIGKMDLQAVDLNKCNQMTVKFGHVYWKKHKLK